MLTRAMTQTQKDRAIKKVEIAIDKMIDLQDMGFRWDDVARILEMLNSLQNTFHCASTDPRDGH